LLALLALLLLLLLLLQLPMSLILSFPLVAVPDDMMDRTVKSRAGGNLQAS